VASKAPNGLFPLLCLGENFLQIHCHKANKPLTDFYIRIINMDKISEFQNQVDRNIQALGADIDVTRQSREWMLSVSRYDYSYNFSWMGRPIIQFPQDMVAMQELVMRVRPDLIIETGIAHGGSLILSASLLTLLDYEDAVREKRPLDPMQTKRRVLGIDIDIRSHNRAAIEAHPMAHRIDMIQGSSIDTSIIQQVHEYASDFRKIMVCLDSNHTHEHVLAELNAYAPLTSVDSYCIVFDTLIEDVPEKSFQDRPWGPGDNPKTAVWEWLKTHSEFEIDKPIQDKLQITVAPDGFLKRIR
jgi:cephalosporin hydroxylase